MKMTKCMTALLGAAAVMVAAPAMAEWAPKRPVEFVVASGAGGGTDNFARTIQLALTRNKIIDVPTVVMNKGGGSGAEAFLYARQSAGDPNKLIFGGANAYLLPHVAKLAFKTEDLQPVAALAVDQFVVWVKADSPYKTITDLIDAAKAAPGTVIFGGSQSKDADETVVSLIEQATGADFKYVPFNGGGEANVQLAGGHITANTNNPSESLGQWQAGVVRPLCVLAPERMGKGEPISGDLGWADIPTCKEAGLGIDSYQLPRTIWAPKDVDPEALAFYKDAMRKVAETPEFKDYLTKTSQTGVVLVDSALADFISKDEALNVKVFQAEGWTAAE